MFQRIRITEFHPIWAQNREAEVCCIIDVRTPEEYAEGHVPGAELLPLKTLPARLEDIPLDRDIYLICRSGGRSAQAAQFIAQECGHRRLVNVEGGTMAWIEAGHPVDR